MNLFLLITWWLKIQSLTVDYTFSGHLVTGEHFCKLYIMETICRSSKSSHQTRHCNILLCIIIRRYFQLPWKFNTNFHNLNIQIVIRPQWRQIHRLIIKSTKQQFLDATDSSVVEIENKVWTEFCLVTIAWPISWNWSWCTQPKSNYGHDM